MRYSAAFLDRDGTVIRDPGYVDDPADVEILPGSAEAISLLNARGVPAVMVTNQSGIGRGYYSEEDFRAVQDEVERQLAIRGCALEAVFHCPHDPDGGCECRKPGLGMHRRASRQLGIELSEAVYVGDKVSDVLPAVKTGGDGFLLRTGQEVTVEVPEGIRTARDLLEAIQTALGGNGPDDG